MAKFLVIVSVNPATVERLKGIVPGLKSELERLSDAGIEEAFRSVTADIFGYVIRSKLKAGQIRAAIESPGPTSAQARHEGTLMRMPFLSGKDNVIVLELGDDVSAAQGLKRIETWLLHR